MSQAKRDDGFDKLLIRRGLAGERNGVPLRSSLLTLSQDESKIQEGRSIMPS